MNDELGLCRDRGPWPGAAEDAVSRIHGSPARTDHATLALRPVACPDAEPAAPERPPVRGPAERTELETHP